MRLETPIARANGWANALSRLQWHDAPRWECMHLTHCCESGSKPRMPTESKSARSRSGAFSSAFFFWTLATARLMSQDATSTTTNKIQRKMLTH